MQQTLPDTQRPAPRAQAIFYGLLSFLIPPLIMGVMFALRHVYPFGTEQIMRHDMYYQYFPFLQELHSSLQNGSSLLWNSNVGMGVNFVALIAYYLSSPLNLLLFIVPQGALREMETIFVLLRLGLAGLSCAILLMQVSGRRDFSVPLFACLYALCGFAQGYYTNIMWLEGFALLPLVMLGLLRLLRTRQFLLYTITLAITIWCNFLIGLYICIFIALSFVCICIVDKVSAGEFFRRLGRIALFSVIAAGMTAVLSLPAYLALQNVYRTSATFPKTNVWYDPFLHIFGNFATMAAPTSLRGLPNVFTGVLSILMLGVFIRAKAISPRIKIPMVLLLAFIIVSGNSSQLYYIWNGFNGTFSFPFRFSFLISFLLVIMGYMALGGLKKPDAYDFSAMLFAGFFVVLCAALGPQDNRAVWVTFAFIGAYFILMALYERGILKQGLLFALLFAAALAELTLSATVALDTVQTSDRTLYPYKNESVQALLADMRGRDPGYYRIEMDKERNASNDPALYGYRGVSAFASTVNANVTAYLQGIGLDAKPDGNCYTYGETTPLVSAMVNLKYQVTRDGFMADDSVYWQKIAEQEDEAALYESLGNLSLGFMVDADALSYQRDETDPFLSQNELFRKITGLSGDLFTQIPISRVTNQGLAITELGGGHYEYAAQPGKNGVMRWICDVPEEGLYYAYLNSSEMDIAEIATEAHRTNVTILRPYAMTVGTCTPGNTITFTSALSEPGASGTAYLSVYRIDQALFAQGLAILADEQMAVDVWEGPEVSGTIQVEQDGLLYTSLPYESGWTAFVDGEEAPIELMSGAMMCLRLTAGEHTVRFTYMTDGLRTGAIISGVSFAALIVCAILQRRGKRKAAAA